MEEKRRENGGLSPRSPRVDVDQNYAQVLIEVGSEGNTIEKAKTIIERMGILVMDIQTLPPSWVLLKLGVKDMREVVFKLTQSGFPKIVGYNASSQPGG